MKKTPVFRKSKQHSCCCKQGDKKRRCFIIQLFCLPPPAVEFVFETPRKAVSDLIDLFPFAGKAAGGQRPHRSSLRLAARFRLRGAGIRRRIAQLAQLRHHGRVARLQLPEQLGTALQEAGRYVRRRRRELKSAASGMLTTRSVGGLSVRGTGTARGSCFRRTFSFGRHANRNGSDCGLLNPRAFRLAVRFFYGFVIIS